MEFNELMESFAARCGLPGLDIQDGGVVLEFNGIAVSFMENEACETILLHAVIGNPPPDTDGSLGKKMLYANYSLCNSCGATLCQNPETKEYAAVLTIPLKIANADLLTKAVGNLVAIVTTWKEVVASNGTESHTGAYDYIRA